MRSIPVWIVWGFWFGSGINAGLLVANIIHAEALQAALYSPLVIAYIAFTFAVSADYMESQR